MTNLEKDFTVFSLESLHIVPIVKDDESGTVYGETLIKCGGVQNVSFEPISSEYTLEGDGGTVEVKSVLEGYTFSFENGVMTFEEMQVLEGAKIAEIKDELGTTTIGYEYINSSTDNPEYFGMIGYVASSGFKVVLGKCKASNVSISLSNKEFARLSVSGTAIKRTSDGVMRRLILDNKPPALTDFNDKAVE